MPEEQLAKDEQPVVEELLGQLALPVVERLFVEVDVLTE